MNNTTFRTPRAIANRKASSANQQFGLARIANGMRREYELILWVIRKYQFPWKWFTILYIATLLVDAAVMGPLILISVERFLGLQGIMAQAIGMTMYIITVGVLILFIVRGFGKTWIDQYREMQVDLAQRARPDIAQSVLEAEILQKEIGAKVRAVISGALLAAFVMFLAVYRNWVINGLQVDYTTLPWQIIWPTALIVGMVWLGRFKELAYEIMRIKLKITKHERTRTGHQAEHNELAQQAIDQDQLATESRDITARSADLVEVKNRLATRNEADSEYYDLIRKVTVQVTKSGIPVPNIPVSAWTSCNQQLIRSATTSGQVELIWSAKDIEDHLTAISINGLQLPARKWIHGASIQIELQNPDANTPRGLSAAS